MKKTIRFLSAVLVIGFLTFALSPSSHSADASSLPGFEDLADKLLPTVVNISTTTKIKKGGKGDLPDLQQLPQFPPGSPFEDFFKDFYEQYKNMPESQQDINAMGSGFIVDSKNGYIVTNNHVIRDADEIKVILHDNTSLDATLVGADEKTDIAVLKVKPSENLAATTWGDSDKSRVGSWILAIGNPFGLGGTVTAGIISARARDINAGPYDDFIQTDASINRGNSGGPMFNTSGEVIGVNTAIFSPSGGSVGIGFAIPSNIVKGIVEQLINYGKTKRGWIGVRIQEVTPEIAESLGLEKAKGAMVSGVTAKSPAEKAGLKTGDVILSFNGQEIDAMRKLPRLVAGAEIGKKASLKVWRKGETKDVDVELGQLEKAEEEGMIDTQKPDEAGKDEAPKGVEIEKLGLSVAALSDTLRQTYDINASTTGVVVTDVKNDGIAAEKGLMPGDVIVEIDQQEVTAPAQVTERIEAAVKADHTSVLLFISRKNDLRFIALKLKK